MFSLEASTTVPYESAAVFAALASVESAVHWQVGVVGVRRARPERGEPHRDTRGGALLVGYYALGVRHTLRTRVTAYTPPTAFAYCGESAAFALDVALGAAPTFGGTAVTYQLRLTVHADGIAASGVGPAEGALQAASLRRLLARRAPRDLARLERYLARRLRPLTVLPLSVPGTDAQNGDAHATPPILA